MNNETLEQFRERVYGFEYHSIHLDDSGCFCTNPNLNNKVDAFGNMKAYIGNTTVFAVDSSCDEAEGAIKRLKRIQRLLYSGCPSMLAERLGEKTFHMTLHDLVSGSPLDVSGENMSFAGRKARELIEDVHKESWTVKLKTTCVFNMVNTSIVLGLEPCGDADWCRITQLYDCLEGIVPLGYPMTPHITLAYYRPGIYHSIDVEKLEDTLSCVSKESFMIEFAPKDLAYQEFCDMNHYTAGSGK